MIIKRKTLLYTAVILTIALYLRLRFVIFTPFEFKIDAWSMYHYALNVINGEYYGHRFGEHWARYAYWPPLYIFLSGLVYRFFGTAQDFLVMRIIQAVFSTASCLLCRSIAAIALKSYSNYHQEAGLAAGILMALNPRMIVYTNHLYVETVFITIYLALVYYALRYFRDKSSRRLKHLLLFSFLLGIGNLTRPVLLLLPGVLLVFVLLYATAKKLNVRRTLRVFARDGAVILLIMLTVFSPWIIRNYSVTKRFILIDTNGPINFYIAHNPLANGQWVDVKPHTDINKLYETGYKEGFDYIIKNIPKELSLLKLKQKLFLYHDDPHISEVQYYPNKTFKLPFMSFEFLWKSALTLLIVFILRLLGDRSLYILFSEPAWIIGNFLYTDLIILIFYFAPRYRIISEPFLCIIIGILSAGILTPDFHIASPAD